MGRWRRKTPSTILIENKDMSNEGSNGNSINRKNYSWYMRRRHRKKVEVHNANAAESVQNSTDQAKEEDEKEYSKGSLVQNGNNGNDKILEEENDSNEEEEVKAEEAIITPVSSPSKKKMKPFHTFNSREKNQVIKYLETYRDIAKEKISISSQKSSENLLLHEIGGHEFPPLTYQNCLLKKYLQFPTTLNGKHRRVLHELCLDIGLYHDSFDYVTEKGKFLRIMVVTTTVDGLPFNSSSHYTIPIDVCRPWFYQRHNKEDEETKEINALPSAATTTPIRRNSQYQDIQDNIPCNFVRETTKKFRSEIQAYISFPLQNCLRSIRHDFVQFQLKSNTDSLKNFTETKEWLYVDTPDKMNQCLQELSDEKPSEMGFDLELYNKSKYVSITCLLQLSTPLKSYIIDPFQVWNLIPKLSFLFSDPNIVKIGHCINSMDIPSLHRDFGIHVVNAFDTFDAARILQMRKQGLAALCDHYGLEASQEYLNLKQKYQRQDWKCRPLTEQMLRYARYDVLYLIELRKLMLRDIIAMDDNERIIQSQAKDVSMTKKFLKRVLSKKIKKEQRAKSLRNDFNANNTTSSRNTFFDRDNISVASSTISDDEGYFTSNEDDSSDEDFQSADEEEQEHHHVTFDEIHSLYPKYVSILQKSQCSTTCFWEYKEEPILNEFKRDIMKQQGPKWTVAQDNLYNRLFEWRKKVGILCENMSGLILSTEFIISVAFKRPTALDELKLISYHLPAILLKDEYREEMLNIIQDSFSEIDNLIKQPNFDVTLTPVKKENEMNGTDDQNLQQKTFIQPKKNQPALFTLKRMFQYTTTVLALGAFFTIAVINRRHKLFR